MYSYISVCMNYVCAYAMWKSMHDLPGKCDRYGPIKGRNHREGVKDVHCNSSRSTATIPIG